MAPPEPRAQLRRSETLRVVTLPAAIGTVGLTTRSYPFSPAIVRKLQRARRHAVDAVGAVAGRVGGEVLAEAAVVTREGHERVRNGRAGVHVAHVPVTAPVVAAEAGGPEKSWSGCTSSVSTVEAA